MSEDHKPDDKERADTEKPRGHDVIKPDDSYLDLDDLFGNSDLKVNRGEDAHG